VKKAKIEIPVGFRRLRRGEKIQKGDKVKTGIGWLLFAKTVYGETINRALVGIRKIEGDAKP
jgi:hypothetical protein